MKTCNFCDDRLVRAVFPDGKRLACEHCESLWLGSESLWPGMGYIFVPSTPQEPIKCRECPGVGDLARVDRSADIHGVMREQSLCFRCAFWTMIAAEGPDPNRAIVNGCAYYITPDRTDGYRGPGVGFGGDKHVIVFDGGRRVVSRNLWTQGEVPKHFRARLPNNARFVTCCAYCDLDATGMLKWYYGDTARVPPFMQVPHCGRRECRPDGGEYKSRARCGFKAWKAVAQ